MATTTTPIVYNTTSGFLLSNSTLIQIVANSASLVNNAGYSTANPYVLSTFQMQASAISAFVETATYGGSDNVQYTILINGVDYYWTGSTWTTSNGTYSQSNTASVINANCGNSALTTALGTGSYVQVRAFLHSNSGNTTPTLAQVALTYTFAAIQPSNPAQCTVWVYLQDILGNTVGSAQKATLSVNQKDPFIYGGYVVAPFVKSTTFNSNGYAQLILDETQTPGYSVQFSISYLVGDSSLKQIDFVPCIVPNAGSCALTSITTFATKSATVASIVGNNSITPIESQISLANNVSGIPIPQLQFSPATFSVVTIAIDIMRQTSGNFFRFIGRINLGWSQSTNTWGIVVMGEYGSSGPSTGVSFAVTTGASPAYLPTISYTSDDSTDGGSYTGYVGTLRFKVINTFLLENAT